MPRKISKTKNAISKNTKNAFILLDFVLALGILSLIAIVLAQATLTFQRHSLAKSKIHLHSLEANNAIDIVRNLLEVESSLNFANNTLRLSAYTIKLESNNLLLDESLILRGVSAFTITPSTNNGFNISICYTISGTANNTNQTCITRAGFLSNAKTPNPTP